MPGRQQVMAFWFEANPGYWRQPGSKSANGRYFPLSNKINLKKEITQEFWIFLHRKFIFQFYLLQVFQSTSCFQWPPPTKTHFQLSMYDDTFQKIPTTSTKLLWAEVMFPRCLPLLSQYPVVNLTESHLAWLFHSCPKIYMQQYVLTSQNIFSSIFSPILVFR